MTTDALESLGLDELEDELAALASHLYAGTCRWLELAGELDRRGGWAASGQGSCAQWLAWRCGLSPRTAREHVRVAQRLLELPLVHAAFARGELSFAKVRAVTRVATAGNEVALLELARVCTAAQLERAVGAYRRVSTAEARVAQEGAFVSVFWEDDGSLSIRGRLAPGDGALLVRALEAMRDSFWRQGRGSAEPRPARQASNAEALVAVAEAALAHGESRPGGERYQVVVHADETALAREEGGCQLADGGALAAETARRLACDASLVRNGRRTRAIPPAMRRALRARDVLFRRRHRRLVHEGAWRSDRRRRFSDPSGRPFQAVPALPRGPPDVLAERQRGLGIDAKTYATGDAQPMDLRAAADFLLATSS